MTASTTTLGRRPARSQRPKRPGTRPDKHVLYEAAVQGADYDLDFMDRVYRRLNGRAFVRFREDFCGTALVAAAWALRRPENRAWGVDLDRATLESARRHRLARMRDAARCGKQLRCDVRTDAALCVDVGSSYICS